MPKKGSKAKFMKNLKKKGTGGGKKKKESAKKKEEQKSDDPLLLGDNPDQRIKEYEQDVHIHQLSVAPIGGGSPLIMSSDIRLIHGHRYGLIGYNGAGKTTLLRKLADGSVTDIPKRMRVLHVHQELDGDSTKVIDHVLKSDTERTALLAEEARLRAALDSLCEDEPPESAEPSSDDPQPSTSDDPATETMGDSSLVSDMTTTSDSTSTVDEDSKSTAAAAASSSSTAESSTDAGESKEEEKTLSAESAKSPSSKSKGASASKSSKRKGGADSAGEMAVAERVIKLTDSLQKVADRLKFIEASTAEARASTVLSGLGFTDKMKNMATSDLSGGWLMRVNLACALYLAPDLLMLDEPTNHLDFPSVIWLSEYLQFEYDPEKIVLIVSHDRRFINDVCTDIIHLDRCRLNFYTGNYDSFMEIRRQRRIHTRKQWERQQKMIKHNEEFIAKFKANKKWSTQAQSRMKMLAKTARIEKVLDDLEFRFYFPEPPKLKNPILIRMEEVNFGYFGEDDSGDTYLLKNVNLRLEMGEKIGILGANGAGKSTLLRLIMGELSTVRGTAFLANECSVGYFAQHHVETLDFNATPLEHLKNVFGTDATTQQIYAQLGRFNLGGEYARRKIGTLSGGQKARVAFAILTWYKPHILVFDEPTNHLDLATIDGLAIALTDFEGSVILVSHDQHFVETVCDEYWAVGNRTVRSFDDFEKCRNYCFRECKPIDVLPREYSTVEVKKRKYEPITDDKREELGLDISLIGKDLAGSSKRKSGDIDASASSSSELSSAARSKKKTVFEVDPEREIDRGMAKGLTPDGILIHLKEWQPSPISQLIVNKLGFIIFKEYFGDEFGEMAPMEFFNRWAKIMQYCVPKEHSSNQVRLVEIIYACFSTALADGHPKVKDVPYAFGRILESLMRTGILSDEALSDWQSQNASKNIGLFSKEIEDCRENMAMDDDDDDYGDSSDDSS